MIGKELDEYIGTKIKETLDNNKFPEYDHIHSDSFSELIDKLIIVHTRVWYLEDMLCTETDPEKIADLKKKSDVAFKEKRPMLVKAIDKTISNMCSGVYNPTVMNIKAYKGYKKEDEQK